MIKENKIPQANFSSSIDNNCSCFCLFPRLDASEQRLLGNNDSLVVVPISTIIYVSVSNLQEGTTSGMWKKLKITIGYYCVNIERQ